MTFGRPPRAFPSHPPCVLPDPTHVSRNDARDVADEAVAFLRTGARLTLYVNPDGVVQFVTGEGEPLPSFSLAGVYDERASARDIAEDILALQREAIA